MNIRIHFLITLLFVFSANVFSQGNPLFGPVETDSSAVVDKAEEPVAVEVPEDESGGADISIFNSFIKHNAELQQDIKEQLADLSYEYQNGGGSSAIWLILCMAFLYGIFHSLGPGHGKVFVFSYILTEKPKVLKAIYTSYLIAFLHGLSGMIIALVIVWSLQTYSSEASGINDASTLISQISYVIMFIIGCMLLFNYIRNKQHSHDHDLKNKSFKFIPFVFSVGMVPCPGTIITVTFLSAMGMLTIGIFASLFIVLGMGLTISLIALLSLFSKRLVGRLYQSKPQSYQRMYNGLSITGALMLVGFGVLFFLGTL